MKALYAVVALPVYAVAIGFQVCVVAYKLARAERRLQREAKAAADQCRDQLRAARAASAVPDENEWGIN